MEVKRICRHSLLFLALFGLTGVAQANQNISDLTIVADNEVKAPAPLPTSPSAVQAASANNSAAIAAKSVETSAPKTGYGMLGLEIDGYVNAGGTFNDHSANYNMLNENSDNQLGLDGAYVAISKKAATGYGVMDWGFGSDFMFGRDARFFGSYKGWDDDWTTGHNSSNYNNHPGLKRELTKEERASYGFAIPQLYGTVSVNNWTFKGGRFDTLLGYETGRADERFFYTVGRNFDVTPDTHSGAIATFSKIPNLDISIGWVNGEDTMFENEYKESLIHGAAEFHRDDATVKYAFLVGDGAMYQSKGDLFRNDVVVSKKLTQRLETAFLFNYGSFSANDGYRWEEAEYEANLLDIGQYFGNVEYETFAGYVFYTLNPSWKVGNRIEWQKATTDAPRQLTLAQETFNFSFGANWSPMANEHLTVRPEIRYDTYNSKDMFDGFFGDDLKFDDQLTLAVDVLCKF